MATQKALRATLEGLSPEEIKAFDLAYLELHNQLHKWNVFYAATVMMGGWRSHDSFHYFKSWILGKGRRVFDVARRDSDDLGQFALQEEREAIFDNELLNYAATGAYDTVTGREPEWAYISNEFQEPEGAIIEKSSLCTNFPKLAAQFPSMD